MTYDECIKQLKKDKTYVLEGGLVEQITENIFLKDNYTKGWWRASSQNKEFFFILKHTLSSLDVELISCIRHFGECWHVRFDNGEWVFLNNGRSLSSAEFIEQYNLIEQRKALNADPQDKDKKRHYQCIRFFELTGRLKDIAVERRFANNFLTQHFEKTSISNFDFIIKVEQLLNKGFFPFCIVETKYKFPMKDGCFGLNIGEMNLYQRMLSYNVHICNLILSHRESDSGESPLNYILNPDNDLKYVCRMIKITDEYLPLRNYNNRGGSINGGKQARNQCYYCLPGNEFTEITKNSTSLFQFIINSAQDHPVSPDYYWGLSNGKIVGFDRLFRGQYAFTDDECQKLINGKEILIKTLISRSGHFYDICAKLPEGRMGFIDDTNFITRYPS